MVAEIFLMMHVKTTSLGQNRFLRFLIAGGINALFGFGIYSTAILLDLPVWGALLTGNIAGIAFNFFTTSRYVFRNLLLTRFPRFVAAYAVTYGVNLKLIEWLSRWVPDSILAQAILTVPMALFSYFFLAKFVFADASVRAALRANESPDKNDGKNRQNR